LSLPRAASALVVASGMILAGRPAAAEPDLAFERTELRESCAEHDPLRRPFFGDLHVHTAHSLDASTQGTRNAPRDAYRFARGERVGLQPHAPDGTPLRHARLDRPLDFAALTDHAEFFGETRICNDPSLVGHDSVVCGVYRRWPRLAFFVMNGRVASSGDPERHRFCGPGGSRCIEAARGPWDDIRDAAEAAYDRSSRCAFTSFVAYEWTAAVDTRNLHRNVLFRNERVPALPATAVDAPTPWSLWSALESGCTQALPGCEYLVIPHNSNLSGGIMFDPVGPGGEALSAEQAGMRVRNEPLVEIMQHKGSSECRTGVGTQDELCDFELLPYDSFMGRYLELAREAPKPSSFVRSALVEGLRVEQRVGVNPFKLGILASTDTHLGTPGLVEEQGYPGHGGAGTAIGDELPDGLLDPIEYNPGGLAVVWAEENSRDALFAALERREVYGTSGPRIVVRLFGGFELPEDLCGREDFAAVGYARGVAMGSDLALRSGSDLVAGGPAFAVLALRDPGGDGGPGAALERIQIVKLWLEDGTARESVVDVARAGEGSVPLDEASCDPGDGGRAALCSVWRDPDFDPAQRALYYARVLEIPTCRWSTRACRAAGVDCRDPASVGSGWEACCDPAWPTSVQERAWTSPIWVAPAPSR
jgi:hypothetical protein